jgi:putative endonuclease
MKSTVEKGRWAEDLASAWLEANGMSVMDRNYRFMKAEVDIVTFDQKEIGFVEVRSLKSTLFGRPEETISEAKKRLIYQASEAWLHEKRMDGVRIRFDVIAVVGSPDDPHPPEITYFRNAFWL